LMIEPPRVNVTLTKGQTNDLCSPRQSFNASFVNFKADPASGRRLDRTRATQLPEA
jgi:hypothetical protein